jgi:hypothetical protein
MNLAQPPFINPAKGETTRRRSRFVHCQRSGGKRLRTRREKHDPTDRQAPPTLPGSKMRGRKALGKLAENNQAKTNRKTQLLAA